VQGAPNLAVRDLGVLSSEGIDLERSAAYRACRAQFEERERYLKSQKPQ
jgi:hypothetical protein